MFRLRKYFDYTPSPVTDGTFSIVSVGGATSRATNKYTFAGDAVTAAATLASASSVTGSGYACGNATIGLFIGGASTTNGCLYTYATNATASRTLIATVAQGQAGGNSTTGIICRGGSPTGTALTLKYTYTGDTMVNGSNLTATTLRGGMAGTATLAIIALGGDSGASPNTNRYTYAGDTTAVATNLSTSVRDASACGNGTVGVFVVSNATVTTTQYQYAGDTSAAGGNLQFTAPSFGNAASGIGTTGLFSSTSSNPPSKYTYSSNTTTSGTAFLQTQARASLANGTQGVTL